MSFWGYGYGQLAKLKTLENPNDRSYEEAASPPMLKTILKFARKMFFNHMLLTVYFGVAVSVLPGGGQELIYSNTGALRPLGDAFKVRSAGPGGAAKPYLKSLLLTSFLLLASLVAFARRRPSPSPPWR